MGVYNTYYVVDEALIKKRLTEEFDIIEYIEDNLVLFHEYHELPFWRLNVKFDLNKGWYPSQEILNELDTFPKAANLYYNEHAEVNQIWQELKKISIYRVEELVSNEEVKNRIKNAVGYKYKIEWIESQ